MGKRDDQGKKKLATGFGATNCPTGFWGGGDHLP
jgi:hypothetical protein